MKKIFFNSFLFLLIINIPFITNANVISDVSEVTENTSTMQTDKVKKFEVSINQKKVPIVLKENYFSYFGSLYFEDTKENGVQILIGDGKNERFQDVTVSTFPKCFKVYNKSNLRVEYYINDLQKQSKTVTLCGKTNTGNEYTVEIDTELSDKDTVYNSAKRWGVKNGEENKPKIIISKIHVATGGHEGYLPFSSFCDLANPNSFEIVSSEDGSGFVLVIAYYEDEKNNYIANFSFGNDTLAQREICTIEHNTTKSRQRSFYQIVRYETDWSKI